MRTGGLITLLTFLLIINWSCKDTNSDQSINEKVNTMRLAEAEELPFEREVEVYAWVDQLRLREYPYNESGVLKRLSEGEALIYLGEETVQTFKATLRGKTFDKPWMKVKAQSGHIGWVYGGGVVFEKEE
ncbi:MAG: SH3 domain-containing protein [Bacteroidetes bacterium]|nr:SH3 domain-containing protein [Bacteroidota bacterium]